MTRETVRCDRFRCRSRGSVSEPGQLEVGCGVGAMKLNQFTRCTGRTRLYESKIPPRPYLNFSVKVKFSRAVLATIRRNKSMLGDELHRCRAPNRPTTSLSARSKPTFCRTLCNTSFS